MMEKSHSSETEKMNAERGIESESELVSGSNADDPTSPPPRREGKTMDDTTTEDWGQKVVICFETMDREAFAGRRGFCQRKGFFTPTGSFSLVFQC